MSGGEQPLSPGIFAETNAVSPQAQPHKLEESRGAESGLGGSRPGEGRALEGRRALFESHIPMTLL